MGRKGYAWAISAGSNAALAAIAAKFIYSSAVKYGCVVLFNVVMWGCYVRSLRDLSSLQATSTNFATNFLASGFAGSVLFSEPLKLRYWPRTTAFALFVWFAGAFLIVIGVLILSTSSIEKKERSD